MSHRGAIGSGPMANAAPLAEWNLPPGFATLRRLMEARMIEAGRRGYVQARTSARDLRHRRSSCRREEGTAPGRCRIMPSSTASFAMWRSGH